MYFGIKEFVKYLQKSFRRNIWIFLTITLIVVMLINGFDNGKPPMKVGVIFADKLDIRQITRNGKPLRLEGLRPANSPCNHLGIPLDFQSGTPLNSDYDPRFFSFRNSPQSQLGIRPVFILRLRPADLQYVNFQEF